MKIMCKYILLSTAIAFSLLSCNNKKSASDNSTENQTDVINMESISDETSMYLLVGTYTAGESEGIYVYQFDLSLIHI